MTEEQMLEYVAQGKDLTFLSYKFSGLCTACGDLFYSREEEAAYCTKACKAKRIIGAAHPNWKGGRRDKGHGGYVTLSGHYDHPKHIRGEIREHIRVMEQHLGRYLSDGENVHHKNRIRNDNRIENLELWTTKQPKGCRVHDLVDYIVDTYPDLVTARLAANINPPPKLLP